MTRVCTRTPDLGLLMCVGWRPVVALQSVGAKASGHAFLGHGTRESQLRRHNTHMWAIPLESFQATERPRRGVFGPSTVPLAHWISVTRLRERQAGPLSGIAVHTRAAVFSIGDEHERY